MNIFGRGNAPICASDKILENCSQNRVLKCEILDKTYRNLVLLENSSIVLTKILKANWKFYINLMYQQFSIVFPRKQNTFGLIRQVSKLLHWSNFMCAFYQAPRVYADAANRAALEVGNNGNAGNHPDAILNRAIDLLLDGHQMDNIIVIRKTFLSRGSLKNSWINKYYVMCYSNPFAPESFCKTILQQIFKLSFGVWKNIWAPTMYSRSVQKGPTAQGRMKWKAISYRIIRMLPWVRNFGILEFSA